MRPEAVAAEIAARTLVAVGPLGLKSAHYPPPSGQPNTPTLILWLRRSPISHGGPQLWTMTVEGWLMTEGDPGLSKAVPVVDALITPIVDAFAPESQHYHLGNQVDFCEVATWEFPEGALVYGGVEYYACKLFWTVKMRRFTGSA